MASLSAAAVASVRHSFAAPDSSSGDEGAEEVGGAVTILFVVASALNGVLSRCVTTCCRREGPLTTKAMRQLLLALLLVCTAVTGALPDLYDHPELVAVAELGLEPHLEPVGPGPARVHPLPSSKRTQPRYFSPRFCHPRPLALTLALFP